jgi:hypothetical protein
VANPGAHDNDIHELEALRSRIPIGMFRGLYKDVDKAGIQYGRMKFHASFSEIVSIFGIINQPEALLETEATKKGRIEPHFDAMRSVSVRGFLWSSTRIDKVAKVRY